MQFRHSSLPVTLTIGPFTVRQLCNESARLSEPPILPNPDRRSEPPLEINPFAPTSAGVDLGRALGRTDLSIAYWAGLTILLFVCFVMILGGIPLGWPSLGWPGIVTTIAAAARVPLLQRHNTRMHLPRSLPNAFALLFTSWALMIVFAVVSFIAFAAVCIPSSIAFLENGNVSNLIFGVSIAASLCCFFVLFALSLRLRY